MLSPEEEHFMESMLQMLELESQMRGMLEGATFECWLAPQAGAEQPQQEALPASLQPCSSACDCSVCWEPCEAAEAVAAAACGHAMCISCAQRWVKAQRQAAQASVVVPTCPTCRSRLE